MHLNFIELCRVSHGSMCTNITFLVLSLSHVCVYFTHLLDYSAGTFSQLQLQVPSENTTSLNNGTVQPNKVSKGPAKSHKLLYSYSLPRQNVTSKQPCPLVPYGLGELLLISLC